MENYLKQIITIARGCWRFRNQALLAAWAASLIGYLLVLGLPDIYEAKAQFYVDNSSRLSEVVSNLGMEPQTNSRVFLVRQAMLATPQLTKVAREADIDVRAKNEAELATLIKELGETITINSGNRRTQGENLYTITFRDHDRATSIAVVNSVLNTFIEDVVEAKSKDNSRAEGFLQEQREYYRQLLRDVELSIEQFKREHPEFSADNRNDYFTRLQVENETLESMKRDYSVEERKYGELRRQLNSSNPYIIPDGSDAAIAFIPGQETAQRISVLTRQRSEMLLRVTPRHPDIRALDEQLKLLRREFDRELSGKPANGEAASNANNPVYQQIQLAMSESNVRLATVGSQLESKQREVDSLSALIDTAPRLEREFTALKRDYTKYQTLYDQVLIEAERERIGRVGEDSEVVTLNIVEPPIVTQEPVSPRRSLLLFAVFIVALGIGAGIAWLLSQLQPVFQDGQELSKAFDLPVLGTVMAENHISQLTQARASFWIVLVGLLPAFLLILLFQDQSKNVLHGLLEQLTA